jgi:hypothetical protein
MELESQPQPGRAIISANEAHRRLGRDRRTIQKMIASGQLEGGARLGKQRRWYVYLDQFDQETKTGQAPPGQAPPIAALQIENSRLRADLVSANEANNLLHAANLEILEAADSQRAAMDKLIQATEWLRQAIIDSESSRQHLSKTVAFYSAALSQYTTPGNLEQLPATSTAQA